MPWNSCPFRKTHMPFTDTFTTHVLAFSERRRRGCGAGTGGPCSDAAARRQEVLEGIATRRAFPPARPSSAGPALPSTGHVGDC